jgi:hypothetical protein
MDTLERALGCCRRVSFSLSRVGFLICHAHDVSSSSTAAKADDKGAQNAVKGYMGFVLYSVAGLACK